MKKIILFIVIIGGLLSFSFAKYGIWGISELDIISREEWGADESLRYITSEKYIKYLEEQKLWEQKKIEIRNQDIGKYADIMKKELQTAKIRDEKINHLKTYFSQDRNLDKVDNEENGISLRRPKWYHYKKDRFIIHHTADDYSNLLTRDDVENKIRNIYKYHAQTKLWGDIGYNFIIDHLGNIYEGKAGGEGIVGAHSSRNNNASIGISLIGNFEIQRPTTNQLRSLTALLTALSRKYNINPYNKVFYHIETGVSPYLKDVEDYSLVGHKDSGKTTCPGRYMDEKMDGLRQVIKENLTNNISILSIKNGKNVVLPISDNQDNSVNLKLSTNDIEKVSEEKKLTVNKIPTNNNIQKKLTHKKTIYIKGAKKNIQLNQSIEGNIVNCFAQDNNFIAKNCNYNNGKLNLDLEYLIPSASGSKKILIQTEKFNYLLKVNLLWKNDIDNYLYLIKQKYKNDYGFKNASNLIEKINYKNSLQDVKNNVTKKVKVLLYELSMSFKERNINCNNGCKVEIDGFDFENVKNILVKDEIDNLSIFLDGLDKKGHQIKIISNDELQIVNYDRKSYAGIPWNFFKGELIIKKDLIKPIGKSIEKKYVLINQLHIEDYMAGIAEVNDQQHIEKIKAMSLISKSYLLFYLNKKNEHPSIPNESSYNAIDDAQIFQKYVGNGFSRTVTKWQEALKETNNKVIIYNNYIPILPYFNCSAGFTFEGLEKYGWSDTPYLKSKIDFYKCDNFNGHGVGLSGQGSQVLAENGIKYSEIIKYYYDGVKIIEY